MDEELIPAIEAEIADQTPQAEMPADEAQPKEDRGEKTRNRIAKLTWEREQARRESQAKDVIIARLQGQTAVQPSLDDQIETRVTEKLAAKQFNDDCNATYSKGTKEFPDFNAVLNNFSEIGGLSQKLDFLDAVNALDNGHAVLHHLGQNLDEASDLFSMKPARMAIELSKISGNLAKPVKKAVSKAPIPPEPMNGKAISTRSVDEMTMAEMFERDRKRRDVRR